MERVTKLIVTLWTCAALAAVIMFIRPGWSALPMLAAVSFGVMAIATAVDRRAVGLVLLVAYVFPIVVRTVTHVNYPPNGAVWTAGLLGAMVPDALRSRWHTTGRWRAALICWALIVAVGATIVCLREFDFTTALLETKRVPNSSIGGWPSMQAAWALHVAVVLLTGILWFDWLHGLGRASFIQVVALPLAASCAITVAVALYQLFVDVTFLNPTVYGAMARASGTLMDGNVCGTIAALWIGGWLLLTDTSIQGAAFPPPLADRSHASYGGPAGALAKAGTRTVVGIVMALACWLTVWATGSRTALLAALIVTLFAVAALVAPRKASHAVGHRRTAVLVAGIIAAAAVVLIVTSAAPTRAIGPMYRLRMMMPQAGSAGAKAVLAELWQRNGYGTVADVMIRSHPVAGVGIGGFQIMQPDFAKLAGLTPLPADNAQNWFKHQLVEFGLLGGLGWIAWVLVFGIFVLRGRRGAPPDARIARGMIIAFAAISLLGMPGQDVSAALTFWTAAFWYVTLVQPSAPPSPLAARTWALIIAVVVAYGALAAWQARTIFRVPVRAQRVGWPYSYGLYPPERDASGEEFRWTSDHGVAVVDAPTAHLLLTVTPNPSAGRNPLGVRLAVDRRVVIEDDVRDAQPIVKYVLLPPGEKRVMIEARASRTFRPADAGLADTRDLGMMLQWRFLPAEPPADGLAR